MANYVLGNQGEGVAQVQQWVRYYSKLFKIPLPAGFMISGTYDAATQTAMRAIQSRLGLVQTGHWGPQTQSMASKLAKYAGSKLGNPFAFLPKVNSIAEDRAYVNAQFKYLFDRPATATELAYRVNQLQGGMTRATWMAGMEKYGAEASVTRIFKKTMGREPTAQELATWSDQLKNGVSTRKTITEYIGSTEEALNKVKDDALAEGAEDQKVALEDLLDEYGLGTLKGWAWDQIKSGVSELRILQNLRETPEYIARFPGMATRKAAGLSAITETQYLDYERRVSQIMRRAGMPPGFYDEPSDYATLMGADLSEDEVHTRVNEGWRRVTEAPVEVRQAFAEMYGFDGDAALAAGFIDPTKAEAALLKQTRAAETKGWGGLFGIDFSQTEAEWVAGADLSTEQMRQGLGQLQEMQGLFNETISETQDLTASKEGAEAVYGLGGEGATQLDERRRTRIAAMSGGGGANITQEGLGLGAAE